MSGGIAVVTLWAEDVRALTSFYHQVLGFERVPDPGPIPHFQLGDTQLAIIRGTPGSPKNSIPDPFPVVAFVVDDFDGTLTKLAEAGVKLPWKTGENLEGAVGDVSRSSR